MKQYYKQAAYYPRIKAIKSNSYCRVVWQLKQLYLKIIASKNIYSKYKLSVIIGKKLQGSRKVTILSLSLIGKLTRWVIPAVISIINNRLFFLHLKCKFFMFISHRNIINVFFSWLIPTYYMLCRISRQYSIVCFLPSSLARSFINFLSTLF